MIVSTKTVQKYLIQSFDEDAGKWYDVPCWFNASFNFITRTYEGADRKPTEEDMEEAKIAVNNFSNSMFRVVKKTIVIIDETNKLRVR